MSIFKETFRKFVRQQLQIREAIISLGNNDGGRMNNTKSIKLNNGKEITLPAGAFYTNTVNRQCVLRMSSGVDLRPDSKGLLEGGRYENPDDLVGPGLAKRYILEGGTFINLEKDDQFIQGARRGFPGSNRSIGFTYGDPLIRANAGTGEDNYGIVPMPGITDANIRTKSAYGSLREAKVNFKCHNQRQLEILELLYMRPGYPILLEWGWTTYIDNDGNNTSRFPLITEFFDPNTSQEFLQRKIIENKISTSGNYDAIFGFCKNFNYKARPDGGYDCTTEITSMGEVIESLKSSPRAYFEESKDEKGKTVKKLRTADEIENVLENINKIIELKSSGYNVEGENFNITGEKQLSYYQRENRTLQQQYAVNIAEKFGINAAELYPFIVYKEQGEVTEAEEDAQDEDQNPATVANGYVRWDAFCHLLRFKIK